MGYIAPSRFAGHDVSCPYEAKGSEKTPARCRRHEGNGYVEVSHPLSATADKGWGTRLITLVRIANTRLGLPFHPTICPRES